LIPLDLEDACILTSRLDNTGLWTKVRARVGAGMSRAIHAASRLMLGGVVNDGKSIRPDKRQFSTIRNHNKLG
jgi:hypothetical protein